MKLIIRVVAYRNEGVFDLLHICTPDQLLDCKPSANHSLFSIIRPPTADEICEAYVGMNELRAVAEKVAQLIRDNALALAVDIRRNSRQQPPTFLFESEVPDEATAADLALESIKTGGDVG